jgi:glycosyltransferase involved in cell wall biosynthesis
VRIGIDGRYLAYRRGIGNYIYNVLDELLQLERHEFILYADREIPSFSSNAYRNLKRTIFGPRLYPVWEQIVLPVMASRDQLDVLFCPANTGPLYLVQPTKLVVVIHDAMFMFADEVTGRLDSLYQRLGKRYRRFIVPRVARRATRVITVSHHSKADIERSMGISDVSVIPEGPNAGIKLPPDASQAERLLHKLEVNGAYFFALTAPDPRKNSYRLISAFATFRKRARRLNLPPHRLVFAGATHSERERLASAIAQVGLDDGQCKILGYVTDDEMSALYSGATAFVYPSLYEGFGLPALEAMSCNTPVIASNASAIPEITGDAALLIDPKNENQIADAMLEVATSSEEAARLRRLGADRVRKFSWARTAGELLQVFERIGRQ